MDDTTFYAAYDAITNRMNEVARGEGTSFASAAAAWRALGIRVYNAGGDEGLDELFSHVRGFAESLQAVGENGWERTKQDLRELEQSWSGIGGFGRN